MHYDAITALLGGTLDYAGTSPPAKKPLAEALAEAAKVRKEATLPWLVSKIALAVEHLKTIDVRVLATAGSFAEPWNFTALGTAPRTPDEDGFLAAVEFDLREIDHWSTRSAGSATRLSVVGYEAKIPAEALVGVDVDRAFEFLAPALDRFSDLGRAGLDPVFEIPMNGEWKASLHAVAEALAQWREDDSDGRVVPGIKARFGGDFTPPPAAIAEVFLESAKRGLRFKATQGLHDAVSAGEGAEFHYGFVNLFAALAFAYANPDAPVAEIAQCLEEKQRSAFRFSKEELEWNGKKLTLTEIERVRRVHGGTFGSCSFYEPEASLRAFLEG